MYMKHFKIGALLLTALLALTACEDEKEAVRYEFTATVEQMASENNNSKVYLLNEEWIYWEMGDMISIGCDQGIPDPTDGSPKGSAYLTGASGDYENYNGSFATTLNWGAKYFLGLHPYDAANKIKEAGAGDANFNEIKLRLKPEQPYRTDEKGDYTFDRQVLPMVAWYGGRWDDSPSSTAFNLDFRSLAGLVRLQFYNKTGAAHTIQNIEVTCADKQLSGMFNVNNYKTYDPYLSSTSTDDVNKKVTLTMPGGGLAFEANALKSFYLVLPAIAGRDVTTNYTLTVKVNTEDNKYFQGTVTVPLRRNGITYLRAIGITNLETNGAEAGLVGNGTEARPFKVYSYAELLYLRNCFNNPEGGNVYVNGQKVLPTTRFRIMRNDITLDPATWDRGIVNFQGKLDYAANESAQDNNTSNPGITNNTLYPLFESISTGGEVKGLTVRCSGTIEATTQNNISPFCLTNNGTIENCNINSAGSTLTFNAKKNGTTIFAGICHTNSGTIRGCGCTVRGTFTRLNSSNPTHFAGICYTNSGTITGCYASSDMLVGGSAAQAAGICHTNNGTVNDSYYAARLNNVGATAWGAIVYQNNNSGTVTNCYSGDGATLLSTQANSSIGGIVGLNSGTINNCRCYTQLRADKVGGIAVSHSAGTIKNSYINDSLFVLTVNASTSAHYAGGLVAEMSGGTLDNSFALVNRVTTHDNSALYGSVVGHLTGGTINNCYGLSTSSTSTKFYGDKTGGTLTLCHLVGGTQADVDCITTVTNANLADLLTSLNANRGSNNAWTRGTLSGNDTFDKDRAPSLVVSSSSKHRNRR